jgi:hypothetical protein
MYMSNNFVQHRRTKHIKIDIHFVQEKFALVQVRVFHVPTTTQFADIFIKALTTARPHYSSVFRYSVQAQRC